MMSRAHTFRVLGLALVPLLIGNVVAAQSLPPEKQTALTKVEELYSVISEMSLTLWNYSETALLEQKSAQYLADIFENEGFSVERGVAEMPTAFVASYGSGRPIIGILAEYDALPGVGNAPVPHRLVRDDGVTSGQGCGHNLFGAGPTPVP